MIVTRYGDVLAMMLDPGDVWRRNIPESVIPAEKRDLVVDASWMLDGEEHKRLRNVIGRINRGSADEVREFTRDLTRQLLGALMEETPPWNLVRVIDEVAIRVIIQYTLKAPMLLPKALRMRELTRPGPPSRPTTAPTCWPTSSRTGGNPSRTFSAWSPLTLISCPPTAWPGTW